MVVPVIQVYESWLINILSYLEEAKIFSSLSNNGMYYGGPCNTSLRVLAN